MEGLSDAVCCYFDGICFFGGDGSIFERGREEVDYCERESLLGCLGSRLYVISIWGDKTSRNTDHGGRELAEAGNLYVRLSFCENL